MAQLFALVLLVILVAAFAIKYILWGNKLFSALERAVPILFPTFDKKHGVIILSLAVVGFVALIYISERFGFDSGQAEIFIWIYFAVLLIFILKYGKIIKK